MANKCIDLIVMTSSLRRKLFYHYHSGPSSGHMGTYKKIRLSMRFFWPHMREDIKQWVLKCAHFVSHNIWRSNKSEIHFSCPITVPFWTMNVDLWLSGVTLDTEGNKINLMNCMCDITQFVVLSPTTSTKSTVLSKIFVS